MHRSSGPAFDWHRDDRAGHFAQENGRLEDWKTFDAGRLAG
jgi:hypothetical protein